MTQRVPLLALVLTAAATFATAQTMDFIIPAAGTGPGAGGSRWQSEIIITNVAEIPQVLTVTFHDLNGPSTSFTESVPSMQTVAIADIVKNRFGRESGTGGVSFSLADKSMIRQLVIVSRTFNAAPQGEFGQDIPALLINDAVLSGGTAVIPGPTDTSNFRFNFGIFAVEQSTVVWRLQRKDGTPAGPAVRITYPTGSMLQYSPGVASVFSETPAGNDVVTVQVEKGRIFAYGSHVDDRMGDPTFVPGVRTRMNRQLEFLGIDDDEDGIVDMEDLDHDGVLDEQLTVRGGMFPAFFRLIANEPKGLPLTYSILNPTPDMKLVDDKGTIQWVTSPSWAGTTTDLHVRASNGTQTADFRIPVIFQ
jgi:hypothetical protein